MQFSHGMEPPELCLKNNLADGDQTTTINTEYLTIKNFRTREREQTDQPRSKS
jgi:hypothetical protein